MYLLTRASAEYQRMSSYNLLKRADDVIRQILVTTATATASAASCCKPQNVPT